ncbi:MAG: DUF3343 domain-containing protein [Clostridia bacterium]|nr:DUF3343 domain-containing protein [Clostridia bacterium]
MKKYLIVTGTVTYAVKGKVILNRKGFKAKVEKLTEIKSNQGCGYAIAVTGDIEKIRELLISSGVKILEIIETK